MVVTLPPDVLLLVCEELGNRQDFGYVDYNISRSGTLAIISYSPMSDGMYGTLSLESSGRSVG